MFKKSIKPARCEASVDISRWRRNISFHPPLICPRLPTRYGYFFTFCQSRLITACLEKINFF
jgi:hypothetical protein